MTLKNAINYFNRLEPETTKKSEKKVNQDFIHILNGLEKMNLKESEVQFIETELDALDLNAKPINKKRHFSKALQHFKKYLMDTFSITTNGYYTNMGIGLGASFGALFGIWFSDIFTTMRVLVAENSNDLFFGLHIPTTILIILFAVLMGVFSKAIYRKDFKTIYGGIINKLDLALAEMEELKG